MKRLGNIYIVIILLFVLSSFLYIIDTIGINGSKKNNYYGNGYKVVYIDDIDQIKKENYYNVIELACLDENDNIKLINFNIEEKDLNDAIYTLPLKYYNDFQNFLPLEYHSPLKTTVEVKKCEKKDNNLIIDINKISDENIDNFIECLKLTYQKMGIKKIDLKVGLSEYQIFIE